MSRLHLLDTNVYRCWVDGNHDRHAEIMEQVEGWGDEFVYLSAVTVAEVEFGLARPHRLDPDLVRTIRSGLSRFPILEIDRHVAEPYAQLRAWLVEHYAPAGLRRLRSLSQLADPITDLALGIQENDLWLASQALATDAVLVTLDRMDRIREAARGVDRELRLPEDLLTPEPATADEHSADTSKTSESTS